MLTLSEELFLLSLEDKKKGRLALSSSQIVPYALGGALLAELALLGRIRLEDSRRVELADASGAPALADERLNELLKEISAAGDPKKITHWVKLLGSGSWKLQKSLLTGLKAKEVLKEEEKRYLWVIPYSEYSEHDASAKYWLKVRLRCIALAGVAPNPQEAALLSLLHACGLLHNLFTIDEYKAANQRVEEIVEGDAIHQAVIEILEMVNAIAAAAALAAESAIS